MLTYTSSRSIHLPESLTVLVSSPLITKAQCKVDLCSQSRSPSWVCKVSEHLTSPCSIPLSPVCGMSWAKKNLGPIPSQLCHFNIPCMVFSSSPGVHGLYCSLQVIFRINCICCNWFLGVCGGGFHLTFLLHHLLFPFTTAITLNIKNSRK